ARAGKSACVAGGYEPRNTVGRVRGNRARWSTRPRWPGSDLDHPDRRQRKPPVPDMPLANVRIPVLVVHHEQDGCKYCLFKDIPSLMDKLGNAPRKQLLAFKGGDNRGDACEAFAYHGFNGLEQEVVEQIATWILAK